MLTIYEALKLPALKGTTLIAGDTQLDKPITWITTIEIIEDISRFQDGEFVVTTGYGLTKNETYRERLKDLIKMKVLSGLAIYTGFYLEEIPEEIIQTAEAEALPLIEIPTTINFSTITKAIVEQIGNQQMRLLKESLNIHKAMTKLALSNHGLKQVLRKLSKLMNASFFVFDDMEQLQASSIVHDSVETKEEKIIIEDDMLYLSHLQTNDNEPDIHSSVFPWKDFYCFYTPIEADAFTYGYLFSLQKKDVWTDMDDIIMDHVSTLLGIELVKQYAIEETKVSLQGELMEEILQKEFLSQEKAIKRGLKLGFDLTKAHCVFFIKIELDMNNDLSPDMDFSQHLHYIVSQTFQKTNRQHILLSRVNEITALIETDTTKKNKEKGIFWELADSIHERWSKHFPVKITIGIGNGYDRIEHISQSANEAEYAVKYAPLLLKEERTIHFDELGFYQILLRMEESGISLQLFYEKYLGNLIQSNQHRTDLILTLETYLAHNCNLQQTSSYLYIHRHTLKYRISQIEKRTGLSLQSPDDRMNLHLAILAYKFVKLKEQQRV